MQLAQTDYYENKCRDTNEKRGIQENMQRTIPALKVHRRLLSTKEINNPINHNNLCIECKFLKEGEEINENQKLRLYHVSNMVIYIIRKC